MKMNDLDALLDVVEGADRSGRVPSELAWSVVLSFFFEM